jgi:hypothetical protein
MNPYTLITYRDREVLKMFKKILVATAVLLLVAGFLFAENRTRKSDDGLGSVVMVQGTLFSLDVEWYLESGGESYELHFGNRRYLESTGVALREGASCTVQGFLDGRELVVSEIELGGKTFRFRDGQGTPLWAKGGMGRAASSENNRRGASRGMGNRGSGSRSGAGNRHGSTS